MKSLMGRSLVCRILQTLWQNLSFTPTMSSHALEIYGYLADNQSACAVDTEKELQRSSAHSACILGHNMPPWQALLPAFATGSCSQVLLCFHSRR